MDVLVLVLLLCILTVVFCSDVNVWFGVCLNSVRGPVMLTADY